VVKVYRGRRVGSGPVRLEKAGHGPAPLSESRLPQSRRDGGEMPSVRGVKCV